MADPRPWKKDNYVPLANEEPVSGKVFLEQVLDRFHIDLSDPVNQLMAQWPNVVGKEIAEHVRFNGLRNGVLYVVCDHPSRATYVRLNSKEMIKTILGVFPEIDLKKIVTRVKSS